MESEENIKCQSQDDDKKNGPVEDITEKLNPLEEKDTQKDCNEAANNMDLSGTKRLKDLKDAELKLELKNRSLPTKGKKAEKCDRLKSHLESQGFCVENYNFVMEDHEKSIEMNVDPMTTKNACEKEDLKTDSLPNLDANIAETSKHSQNGDELSNEINVSKIEVEDLKLLEKSKNANENLFESDGGLDSPENRHKEFLTKAYQHFILMILTINEGKLSPQNDVLDTGKSVLEEGTKGAISLATIPLPGVGSVGKYY